MHKLWHHKHQARGLHSLGSWRKWESLVWFALAILKLCTFFCFLPLIFLVLKWAHVCMAPMACLLPVDWPSSHRRQRWGGCLLWWAGDSAGIKGSWLWISVLLRQKRVKFSQRVGASCNKEQGDVAKQVCFLFNEFPGIKFSSSLKMFHLLAVFHYICRKPPEI